jgi:hypothetical protein
MKSTGVSLWVFCAHILAPMGVKQFVNRVDFCLEQGQAMREQAVLREEMQYHYRLGNVDVCGSYPIFYV